MIEHKLRRQLATHLVQYRADNHLTQKQMAARIGVTRAAYARYESCDNTPSAITVLTILALIGISIYQINKACDLQSQPM